MCCPPTLLILFQTRAPVHVRHMPAGSRPAYAAPEPRDLFDSHSLILGGYCLHCVTRRPMGNTQRPISDRQGDERHAPKTLPYPGRGPRGIPPAQYSLRQLGASEERRHHPFLANNEVYSLRRTTEKALFGRFH